MSTDDNRKLADLRVIDLRIELEKRDLDKSGNKNVLLERLQKAMEKEGLNCETHVFETDKKPSKRPATTSSQQEDDVIHKVESEDINKKQEEDETVQLKTTIKSEDNEKDTIDNVTSTDSIQINLEEGETLYDEVNKTSSEEANEMIPTTLGQEDKKITTNKDEDNAAKEVLVADEKIEEKQPAEVAPVRSATSSASKLPFTFTKKMSENRNLWITNISQNTRATELKQILAAHGKVIGAKVVINAKYPGACCYGYVTMETVKDAENCIANLNNTELNGQIICVEKVRPDHMIAAKMSPKKKPDDDKSVPTSVDKNENSEKENAEKKAGSQVQTDGLEKESTKAEKESFKKPKSSSKRTKSSSSGSKSNEKRKGKDVKSGDESKDNSVLTFNKIKAEREYQRLREKERLLREENRRRYKEATRQREVDRLQRMEATRLERERAKLRLEREKLEKDKIDIMRLDRERQKLEQAKFELEKLELERVRLRLQEEDRRTAKRPSNHAYRREESFEDRKRSRQYEDSGHFVSSRESKTSHYSERERSPHYRRDDRDRRAIPAEPARTTSRDPRFSQGKEPRFDGNNMSINTWGSHSGPPPSKVFTPSLASGGMKTWSSNRWPSSNSSSRPVSSAGFPVNATVPIAVAPSAAAINNFVGGDRFDFKPMSNVRKY